MRNRDIEARIYIRGDELKMLRDMSAKNEVNLTEMVRILITNAGTAGVQNVKRNI